MWCRVFKVRLMALGARVASRVCNSVGLISMSFHFTVPDELGRCSCHWWRLGGEGDVAVAVVALAHHVGVRVPSRWHGLCLKRGACLTLGRFSFPEAVILVCVRLRLCGRAVHHGRVLSTLWGEHCQREKRWCGRVVQNLQSEAVGTWCKSCELGGQHRWGAFNFVSLRRVRWGGSVQLSSAAIGR